MMLILKHYFISVLKKKKKSVIGNGICSNEDISVVS